MATPHHFLDTLDLTRDELLGILDLIRVLKDAYRAGAVPEILPRARLAMIFEEPSTRTRVSFENAMTDLGGHALYLKPGEIHFGSHEDIKDTARVISSMCDGIMIRTVEHETLLKVAEYSSVPVFNAMTYYIHPTQGVCDVFTMLENLPAGKKLEDLNVVFVGDSSATGIMAMETGHTAAVLGLNYTIASPAQYSISDAEAVKIADRMAASGGTFRVTDDVRDAIKDADFIVPDVWYYYGYEDEKDERLAAFMPRYQVNMAMMNAAPPHAKALHCLPATREVEITSEVLDSPTRCVAFQEAENRLHTQRGLLAWYLGPRMAHPTPEQKADFSRAIAGRLPSADVALTA